MKQNHKRKLSKSYMNRINMVSYADDLKRLIDFYEWDKITLIGINQHGRDDIFEIRD